MADIILKGIVHPDGHITIDSKVDLPPGEVEIAIHSPTYNITLEEAKVAPEPELTEAEWAEYHRLNQALIESAEVLDLPDDLNPLKN